MSPDPDEVDVALLDPDGVPDLGSLAPFVDYPPPLPPGVVETRRIVDGVPLVRRSHVDARPPSLAESLGPARVARIRDEVARGVTRQPLALGRRA
ncbi:MAG: hypothetical protein ACTHQ3_04695 [Motilibacteraceae bacterium]